jgi:hypothetical protein
MTEKVQLPLFKDFTALPTGKNHISFSELTVWSECSWRHKLIYIDKLGGDPPNQHTEFGHALHGAMENFLFFHKKIDYDHGVNIEEAAKALSTKFDEMGFEDKGKAFENGLRKILAQAPEWLNEEFPGWQLISAEFMLFEKIDGQKNKFFKGYIDCIIRYPKPPRKGSKPKPPGTPIEWQYHIIDWKGTDWGWTMEKKTDPLKQKQLVLYKHNLCEKLGLDLKEVKCSFVLCKRKADKEGKHFELVTISVGPETIKKALDAVERMVNSVAKRMYMKNRYSCTYCRFKDTEHCP